MGRGDRLGNHCSTLGIVSTGLSGGQTGLDGVQHAVQVSIDVIKWIFKSCQGRNHCQLFYLCVSETSTLSVSDINRFRPLPQAWVVSAHRAFLASFEEVPWRKRLLGCSSTWRLGDLFSRLSPHYSGCWEDL